ncbi:hypothetical protein ACFZCU_11255 [Streptomyces canus]
MASVAVEVVALEDRFADVVQMLPAPEEIAERLNLATGAKAVLRFCHR